MWYIGVLINVVGSLSINLSTNVIKLAHSRLDELVIPQQIFQDDEQREEKEEENEMNEKNGKKEKEPEGKKEKNYKAWYNLRLAPNRLWLAAMIVFVVANLANFASFAFAAQSLLAALGSIQFVSNVAFARLVNKERITSQTVVGTTIIVAGCVTLVLFGPHDSPSYSVGELMAMYGNAAYIAYLCIAAVVVVFSYAVYWWRKRRSGTRILALYVLFSAIIGTQSVLYGKSLSLLFRASLAGSNVVKEWYSWMCLLAFLLAAFYWVRRFNKGLRYFAVMRAMPAMQVGWILFSLVSGGIYFQEFRGFTAFQWGMFTLGVVGVIFGVVVVGVGCGGRTVNGNERVGGAVRRVSTLYDAVAVADVWGKGDGDVGSRRSCASCGGGVGGGGRLLDDLEGGAKRRDTVSW